MGDIDAVSYAEGIYARGLIQRFNARADVNLYVPARKRARAGEMKKTYMLFEGLLFSDRSVATSAPLLSPFFLFRYIFYLRIRAAVLSL